MPALKESKIEDFAFDYLNKYYCTLYQTEKLYVAKEQQTKKGHIASGIFVCQVEEQHAFIASLKLDPSAQLATLLVTYKKDGLSKLRFMTAFAGFAAGFYWGAQTDTGLWAGVLSVALALASFIVHSILEQKWLKRKVKTMVEELKKQPADQQWLGLSVSSLCFRNNYLGDYLLELCKKRGIGILTVGKRAKVVVVQEPKTIICRRGDFLSYYRSEAQIRTSLQKGLYLRVA
ncbi:hypothetical protein [Pontibacter chitinilyticus]|uniref:hypothetical protein n=1 Tax=Pontibacter chitinilyticus TaxID=2674989 RepID=UPI00321BAAF2